MIIPFHNTVLDKADLNRILHSDEAQQAIAPDHRAQVGDLLVAYKYDDPIGRMWRNTKRYAFMSSTELDRLRTEPCGCCNIAGRYKSSYQGQQHLLTSDPHILCSLTDTGNLEQVCSMGAKYRPTVNSAAVYLDASSRAQVLHDVTAPIRHFAHQAEARIGTFNSMQPWLTQVLSRVEQALDAIPDGTCIRPLGRCLTHMLTIAMKRFLTSYQGRGVVCTSVDKAETTLLFMCPRVYADMLLHDLETGGTYQISPLTQGTLLHVHNSRHYGIPVDPKCQSMPHYVGTGKMHKDPPEMRFISSVAP